MNILKRFIDKAQAFRVSRIAGELRQLAEMRKGLKPKKEASNKVAYEWGTLGLSKVSAEIKNDYGQILSRRERKSLSIKKGEPLVKYFNN